MPGMDGFQVMEGLKEIETEGYLPVLAVTAQSAHKLRALQGGAKDFISKPFDLAEVLMRVHNMLEVRLLHEAARNHGKMLEALALKDPLTRACEQTTSSRQNVDGPRPCAKEQEHLGGGVFGSGRIQAD
jgi:DNA-binding response OmpR family regulator